MRIAIMGETRHPVLPYGPGGLARTTHDIASGLLTLGHDVTLFAMPGSEFQTVKQLVDPSLYDVYLDFSHDHSWRHDRVLHLLGDRECRYVPPCGVVQSEYMRKFYPSARVIPAGVNVDKIPFHAEHGDYLVFAGANVSHKQPDVARKVADVTGRELRLLGPEWERVDEAEKLNIIGHALGLLCPYTIDAAPRLPLEAAACGTPTLCLDRDGTRAHVVDDKTGFICRDEVDLTLRVGELSRLDRSEIRRWVEDKHNNKQVIPTIAGLLESVMNGERW